LGAVNRPDVDYMLSARGGLRSCRAISSRASIAPVADQNAELAVPPAASRRTSHPVIGHMERALRDNFATRWSSKRPQDRPLDCASTGWPP